MKKISIYLHIPFCIRKCAYCDFLSAPAEEAEQQRYVFALCNEIASWKERMKEYEVDTVFFGGGTPSCLKEGLLEKILCKLKETFRFTRCPEISVEVNPGTVDISKMKSYFEAGINRLSIGLQSPFDQELKLLGRIHTYEDFMSTYKGARSVGFDNINIDLMSALPKQSLERYLSGLKKVLAWEPEHISAYSLIIEENTPFYQLYAKHPELLPDEETDRAMYDKTREYLLQKGYERYEISNYAKSGKACRHNLTYWRRGEYLGLGLGASSLLQETRFRGIAELPIYLECWQEGANGNYEDIKHLTQNEQMEEFMFLGLRCMEGVSVEAFYQKFGLSMETVFKKPLEKYVEMGFMERIDTPKQLFRLSKEGIDVSNAIFSDFLL